MKSAGPGPGCTKDDVDGELVLIFLTELQALEQALFRAGFVQAGRVHGSAQPDWVRFVLHIERRFRPDSSPELQGAVSYLLYSPDKLERRRKRLESTRPGEASSPERDVLWLLELILEARNRLTYGLSIVDEDGFDAAYVTAALLVVEAWSYCDPTVERLLGHLQ